MWTCSSLSLAELLCADQGDFARRFFWDFTGRFTGAESDTQPVFTNTSDGDGGGTIIMVVVLVAFLALLLLAYLV